MLDLLAKVSYDNWDTVDLRGKGEQEGTSYDSIMKKSKPLLVKWLLSRRLATRSEEVGILKPKLQDGTSVLSYRLNQPKCISAGMLLCALTI